ncbi:MAG: hypothetical protein RSB02_02835, partial [Anaerovoracaceae bacterium]
LLNPFLPPKYCYNYSTFRWMQSILIANQIHKATATCEKMPLAFSDEVIITKCGAERHVPSDAKHPHCKLNSQGNERRYC